MSLRFRLVPAAVLLAGCHSADVTVRGTFAGAGTGADSTLTVWAVEAQREVPVRGGAFEMKGLVGGPLNLEVRSHGTRIARIEVPDLPAGGTLALGSLRIDPPSGRAFPASVELSGARVVTVNGVRMAPADRLSGDVDVRGSVLAVSAGGDAILVRPAEDGLPDLRVVVVPTTRTATPDGTPAALDGLARGDSLRVKGTVQQGYVMAAGIEVRRRL
ncbi:MAG: hypothetical protein JWM27_4327 [Gemmatimonadetes bacterium]|nr:hypothetical protein [Gemmatimonadota bacterium]